MRFIFALAMFVFFGTFTARAADALKELFSENYTDLYQARYCGENAKRLIMAAKKEFGSVDNLRVVSLTNEGFSVFGMVNAEKTRGVRWDKPSVVEANWYHHAFVVDDRGLVYDFDFEIEPRVLPMKDYLEEMYLDEPECAGKKSSGRFCAGRKNKLADYLMTSINAENILSGNKKDEPSETKVVMNEAFENWQVLFE